MKHICSNCKKEFENDKDSTRIQKNILTGKYVCLDCAFAFHYAGEAQKKAFETDIPKEVGYYKIKG